MIPSVVCADLVAERLDSEISVAVPHQHGCLQVGDDLSHSTKVLLGIGRNPNAAATVVVSLGCETLAGRKLADRLRTLGQPVELVEIQRLGGTAAAISTGQAAIEQLYREHGGRAREAVPQRELKIGLDAGEQPLADAILAEAHRRELQVAWIAAEQAPCNHPELAARGAQVIVSIVAEEQAPVGFALCPVVAVATDGELHTALRDEFDLVLSGCNTLTDARRILDRAEAAFDGQLTAAEQRGSREFVLRRLAITL